MAMICKKCGGLIPDIILNNKDKNNCKNHVKKASTFKGWLEVSKR